ncbi:MAG TPA: hypothetical protein VGK63_02355, partial [Candidatus Limnocylindrales bacterium]
MTVLDRPAERATRRAGARERPRAGVVGEIAARRRADIERELADVTLGDLRRQARRATDPRPFADVLAAPGLHLIAEVKRASPSAGAIAPIEDPAVRARAYAAGEASAISVLCEPHWFGARPEDLEAVRAAVSVPVLAKEFVVDRRQLPLLRARGADAVLLLAVLHPRRRLAALVAEALDLGLEPLVEAHDERELDAALATAARVAGVNNRDLRTLEVDLGRAAALRASIPEDRIAIAESGVRDETTLRTWRAIGYDAALVGETLVRSADPTAAARAMVAAGRQPSDPANRGARPFVKICGVTDEAGALAAVRSGADAIGLNLVPGTPRELSIGEATTLARLVRAAARPEARPRIVLVTVDRTVEELRAVVAEVGADAVQLSGDEPRSLVEALVRAGVEAWKVVHVGPSDRAEAVIATAHGYRHAGAVRVLLDATGGPFPGGTGRRLPGELVAAVAREVPIILAGGLDPALVGPAARSAAVVGVDVASGVERPPLPGERRRKDPLRVALFAKRACAARVDRPILAARPTPVHRGLLEADAAGRWGVERDFGGRYVPETLVAALADLESAWARIRR